MVGHFPDSKTAPVAKFVRGDRWIVARFHQISTQVGNILEFDFKADQVTVSFTPTFTNSTLTGIFNLAIQNALKNAHGSLRLAYLFNSSSSKLMS